MDLMQLTRPLRAALAVSALLVTPFALAQPSAGDAPKTQATLTKEKKDEVLSRVTDILTKQAYVPNINFAKWGDYVGEQKDAIDKATTDDQFANAVQNALSKYGISHVVLLPPRAAEARVSKSTVGVGIRINVVAEGVLVISTVDGAPAQKAGIEAGDLIVEADGQKVDGPGRIAGEEGTKVTLKVKKSDGSFKEYVVTRAKFSTVRPEELAWADADSAVIKIWTFDTGYDRERVEKLMGEAAKSKRLIVDLRGNGGGAVMNMMHFLNLVLPPKSLVGSFISKRDEDSAKENGIDLTDLKALGENAQMRLRTFKSAKLAPYTGQVSVLVDGGSGSASEISAQAFKEILNSPVVGTKSAGAVLVSTIVPLASTGYQLQYPLFDYVSGKGVRLEHNGVVPDLVADKSPAFLKAGEKDPAWALAVGLLKKMEAKGR